MFLCATKCLSTKFSKIYTTLMIEKSIPIQECTTIWWMKHLILYTFKIYLGSFIVQNWMFDYSLEGQT